MNARRNLLTLIAIFGIFSGAHGQQLPPPKVASSVGISVHELTNPDQDFRSMQSAGFRIVRMDLRWDRIEQKPGVFDFSSYDRTTSLITQHNLRPLFILAYSNPLYSKNGTKNAAPVSNEARSAYVRFVKSATLHYASINPIWEIWNEPDNDPFWPPKSDASQYIALATDACNQIKSAAAGATVIAPAAAHISVGSAPVPFLQAVISSDLMHCIDGLSVHPYLTMRDIDTTPDMWSRLRTWLSGARTQNRSSVRPVSSEWGLSTFSGISDQTQAAYLIKMITLNVSEAVPISVVYDWKDDGTDARNPANRFGLNYFDGRPKPAYFAIKRLTTVLADDSFACKSAPNGNVAVWFADPKKQQRIGIAWPKTGILSWRATANDWIDLGDIPPPDHATDLFGTSAVIERQAHNLRIRGGYQPFYIFYGNKSSVNDPCSGEGPSR